MPWHPGRCARLELTDGTVVGHAGELHPKVVEALGLPARAAAFEVDLSVLVGAASGEPVAAAPVSAFPAAKEDFAFVVDGGVPAEAVRSAIVAGAGELLEDVALFDVFTGEQVGEGKKSLAYSLRLRAADRTLSAKEVRAVRDAVVESAADQGRARCCVADACVRGRFRRDPAGAHGARHGCLARHRPGDRAGSRASRAGRRPARAGRGAAAAVAAEIRAQGATAVELTADVSDPAAVRAAVGQAEDALGSIDLLVNNAGAIESEHPLWEADPDEWWSVFETNVRAPFLFSRYAVPGMIARGGGRVIDLASGASSHEMGGRLLGRTTRARPR